jgi:two-component system, OmpR family, alkaline phosphatase synthesis response regulator PhoP
MASELSPKVLIVEDDSEIRLMLATALRREDLIVDIAADGAQALELCQASEYAVILLDLMMPHVSGYDFLDHVANRYPSAHPVIIVITAFDDRLLDRLSAARVHATIRKPFDVLKLAATIREVAIAARDHLPTPSLPQNFFPDRHLAHKPHG